MHDGFFVSVLHSNTRLSSPIGLSELHPFEEIPFEIAERVAAGAS